MDWQRAPDLQKEVAKLISTLKLSYIDHKRIIVFRSFGSTSRAQARIWSLPRIWQKALQVKAHYCLEVISERFDKLPLKEKRKVLIHELLHIPKNFSGSLLPHRGRGRRIDRKVVEELYRQYVSSSR